MVLVMDRKRSRELSSPTGVSPRQIVKRTYKQRRGEQVKGKKKLSLSFSREVADNYLSESGLPPKIKLLWTTYCSLVLEVLGQILLMRIIGYLLPYLCISSVVSL